MKISKNIIKKYSLEFEKAILIRKCEERLLELYNEGKLNGTVHTCIGQEFSGVAVSKFLLPQDFVVSNHRGHGHYISRTGDLSGFFAELMGKVGGCSGGIGGSQHFYNKNYLSNGIQGGMTPVAAGIGLANKIKKKNAVAVAYIGDGTLGEGVFYETLNLVSLWKIPIIFVLENNGIAQTTNNKQSISGSVEGRAKAFGIRHLSTTTDNIPELFNICESAINESRKNEEPILLEIKTNRLKSHSKGDDNRDPNFVNSLNTLDPINQLEKLDPILFNSIVEKSDLLISSVLKEVELFDTLKKFETTVDKRTDKKINWGDYNPNINVRGNDSIYESLKSEMALNENVILLGEDIESSNDFNPGEYGGAFKVTKDLSILFKERVKNTPISEQAITGISTGLAVAGMKPVLEIMFGDFMTLVFDQILQHASKFRLMFNNKVKVPLIIRSPMGGYRGYGPTHSQSIEKHFLGIPDLDVLALNHRLDPKIIYEIAFKNNEHPTFIVENKIAYTRKINESLPTSLKASISDEHYPTFRLKFDDEEVSDCTIVCYGGALLPVEDAVQKAFFEEEYICEVICPTLINPINIIPILESVKKSGKLILVEEGSSVAGFGSEIISLLSEKRIRLNKVIRISNNTIIPCSFQAENDLLPNEDKIYKKIKEILK